MKIRPFAIVSEATAAWVASLGAAELARVLEWARPRYNLRRDIEARGGDAVVLTPAQPVSLDVTSVWATPDNLHLCAFIAERNEVFRQIVKLRYDLAWQGQRWEAQLTPFMGSPSDRVAELSAALLSAGFIVRVPNAALAEMVVRGTWVPRQWRWVKALQSGQLLIVWEHGGDAVWKATQNLGGARYDKDLRGCVISPTRHTALRDFADEFGFHLTEQAEQLLRAAEAEERQRLLVTHVPSPAQPKRKPRRKGADTEVVIPSDLLVDED